jgi:hypothetical protein
MVHRLCTSGNHEVLKCGVHGAAGVIAALMAAYNIAACCFRTDRHLRVNAMLYSLAAGYEVNQTLHHLRSINGAVPGGRIATPQACRIDGGGRRPENQGPDGDRHDRRGAPIDYIDC